jgi:hypothetical protein
MRRNVVGQHQDRRLALLHEVARHGEHEIRVGEIHLLQEVADLRHRDLGPALHEVGTPAFHVVVVELGRHLLAMAGRLGQHRGDDAAARALDQVPDEGLADAVAQHHELLMPR